MSDLLTGEGVVTTLEIQEQAMSGVLKFPAHLAGICQPYMHSIRYPLAMEDS